MKSFIILPLLMFSFAVQATNLTCVTQKPLETSTGPVTIFTLSGIEKTEYAMESSLPDQNTLSDFTSDKTGSLIGASFSNECDNMYDVVFKAEAFKAVVSGAALSIVGQIDFSSADGISSGAQINCQVDSTLD